MKKIIVLFHMILFFVFYSSLAFSIIFVSTSETELISIFISSFNKDFGNISNNIVQYISFTLVISFVLVVLCLIIEICVWGNSSKEENIQKLPKETPDSNKAIQGSSINPRRKFHIVAVPALIALSLFTITYNMGTDNPALLNGLNHLTKSPYPSAKDADDHRHYRFPLVGDDYSGGPFWNYSWGTSISKGASIKSSLYVMSDRDTEVTLSIINKENAFHKAEEISTKTVDLKANNTWIEIDIEGVNDHEVNEIELRLYSRYVEAQEIKFKEPTLALKDNSGVVYIPRMQNEKFCFKHRTNDTINTVVYEKGTPWSASKCYEDIDYFKNEE